jgi:hypothetical protein
VVNRRPGAEIALGAAASNRTARELNGPDRGPERRDDRAAMVMMGRRNARTRHPRNVARSRVGRQ